MAPVYPLLRKRTPEFYCLSDLLTQLILYPLTQYHRLQYHVADSLGPLRLHSKDDKGDLRCHRGGPAGRRDVNIRCHVLPCSKQERAIGQGFYSHELTRISFEIHLDNHGNVD